MSLVYISCIICRLKRDDSSSRDAFITDDIFSANQLNEDVNNILI